jgi:hypothetical protein
VVTLNSPLQGNCKKTKPKNKKPDKNGKSGDR